MTKNKRRNNPTQKETKLSIESSYEQAANNFTNYSTEQLGSLEIAAEEDPHTIKSEYEHRVTIGKKKINKVKK